MRSKAAIFGHPIHPMLVPLPIGLAIWTLVADIVYLATGHETMWYDIAYWSGWATWISGLTAALPGFVDYLTVVARSDASSMATFHMVLNVTVVGIFILNTILMYHHGALTGGRLGLVVLLHAVGVSIFRLSGWLGGEMTFRRHIGMVPDDSELEGDHQ